MKISDFQFTPDNHFVAMEYYWFILNRIFLILITEKELIGIKVHGPIGVESHEPVSNPLSLAIDGDLHNPYSYIDTRYIERIKDTDLASNDFFRNNRANFVIHRHDIVNVTCDKTRKWGMGYYPHDGKIYVTTKRGRKREFIILGSQSADKIRTQLSA